MQTWAESDGANVIRSEMEMAGFVKVRRRTTYASRIIEAGVTLPGELYQDFRDWFVVNCQSGALPTRVKRPHDGAEMVVRFVEAPRVEWPQSERSAFKATLRLEQLPAWRNL